MVTITEIEQAMCARLSDGLGVMVTDVVSWDVMTDDLALILGRLPGAFITFTGITASVPHDTRRTRYKVTGRFAVYVADYNLRGNESLRHGDARLDEPGCYRMIRAVRRLLAGQDMGLDIGNLRPGTVRMVTGRAFSDEAVALYECLFDTTWYEDCLPNRHWPVPPASDDHPDYDFVRWQGRLDAEAPAHDSTHGTFSIQGEDVAEDTVIAPMENTDD